MLDRKLEELAKVTSIPNRGWQGLRRVGADPMEEATQDEGVRNAAGGWTGQSLRRRVYLDPRHPKVKLGVAEARRVVRQGLTEAPVRPNTSPMAKKAGGMRNKRGA